MVDFRSEPGKLCAARKQRRDEHGGGMGRSGSAYQLSLRGLEHAAFVRGARRHVHLPHHLVVLRAGDLVQGDLAGAEQIVACRTNTEEKALEWGPHWMREKQ